MSGFVKKVIDNAYQGNVVLISHEIQLCRKSFNFRISNITLQDVSILNARSWMMYKSPLSMKDRRYIKLRIGISLNKDKDIN